MQDRGPILRLVLVGVLGVALVLLAQWMARRMASSRGSQAAPTTQGER